MAVFGSNQLVTQKVDVFWAVPKSGTSQINIEGSRVQKLMGRGGIHPSMIISNFVSEIQVFGLKIYPPKYWFLSKILLHSSLIQMLSYDSVLEIFQKYQLTLLGHWVNNKLHYKTVLKWVWNEEIDFGRNWDFRDLTMIRPGPELDNSFS